MSRQNNALPQMVEPLWSTYIHQKGARLGLPVTGTFELTPRCNFNCNMCYVHQTETQAAQGGRRELTTAEWLAIAEEARKAGMVFLLLTGGEPLLRPDFPELLHALKNMGFLVSVNSNGSLLRGELLEAVKRDPPLRFNITLYGGSNATYERLCGRAMFQEVVDNLRALKDAGIPVRLNVSVTPDNKDDVPEIFRLARELGLHAKASTYMYPPVRLDDGRPAPLCPGGCGPLYAAVPGATVHLGGAAGFGRRRAPVRRRRVHRKRGGRTRSVPGGAQLLLAHLGRADDPLRHDGLPRDTGDGTGVFRRLAVRPDGGGGDPPARRLRRLRPAAALQSLRLLLLRRDRRLRPEAGLHLFADPHPLPDHPGEIRNGGLSHGAEERIGPAGHRGRLCADSNRYYRA